MELVDCYKKNPSVSFNCREKEVWENLGAEKQKLLTKSPLPPTELQLFSSCRQNLKSLEGFFFLFFFSEYVEEMS